MAVCHSSVGRPESTAMGAQQQQQQQQQQQSQSTRSADAHLQARQYSVSRLVDGVHRLEHLCWPLLLLWRITVFVARWESPSVTLSYWITSVLICYFMESSQLFASGFTLLLLLAGAGAMTNLDLRHHGRPSASRPAGASGGLAGAAGTATTTTTTSPSSSVGGAGGGSSQGPAQPSPAEADRAKRGGRETLVEYRQLMLQAQDLLARACQTLERTHAVLRWRDDTWSPLFYSAATLVLLMLCLLPLRWCVMAAITCVLCLNQRFVWLIQTAYQSLQDPARPSQQQGEASGCTALGNAVNTMCQCDLKVCSVEAPSRRFFGDSL